MADKFVFSNFATTALREAVGPTDTEFLINVDDVWKFPSLAAGAKFPLILAASDDLVEIVYVSALTLAGVATVERAQEGTLAQSWLAGTHLRHSVTAATLIAAAGLRPRGTWSAAVQYDQGDVVEHVGISYAAVQSSLNQAPAPGSAHWQLFYQPPGAASTAMNFQGIWSSSTTYSTGQVVTYKGRVWQANAGNTNSAPAIGNANWTHIAKWSGLAAFEPVLAFTGTNNYSVVIAPSEAPVQLYDGLTVRARFANTNTAAVTGTINALAAAPFRPKAGVEFAAGEIIANELYEFSYVEATGEFIALNMPAASAQSATQSTAIAAAAARLTAIEAFLDAFVGTVVDYMAVTIPAGFLACNGALVSRVTYAKLFNKIGTQFGVGDGSTTFGLPDLRERVVVGSNYGGASPARISTYLTANLGAVGGSQHMMQHNHGITDPGHDHSANQTPHSHNYSRVTASGTVQSGVGVASWGTVTDATTTVTPTIDVLDAVTGISVLNAGTGNAGNLQPCMVATKMIYAGA